LVVRLRRRLDPLPGLVLVHGMETTRTPWPLIAALYAAGLIAATQFAKVSLSLAPLAASYPGLPVAFVVSAVAVMGILFGVVAGGITARLRPRRAILIGLAISALAGLLQAGLPDFPLLMALRIVEGAGHLLLVVAVPTLMAQIAAPRDRAVVMGIWATFFGVGFALAALIIGANVPLTFAVHAALAGLVGLLLWRLLPAEQAGEKRPLPGLHAHLAIYRNPRLFAPALGHGIYASLFLALVTYVPVALEAPWLSPILPVVGLLGSLSVGLWARFVSPAVLVWGGFAALAVIFAAASFAGPWAPALAILGLGLSGIVAGGGFAAVPWLNDTETDRALANGALAQLGNVGTFSGTPLIAALGVGAAFPVGVGLSLLGALALFFAYTAATRAAAVARG